MKTVTELARESGLTLFQDSEGHCVGVTDEQLIAEARMHDDARLTRMLQRFHDLAIAQYRESLLAGVGEPDIKYDGERWYAADQMAAAVLRERERCAKAIEAEARMFETLAAAKSCAAAIRGQA